MANPIEDAAAEVLEPVRRLLDDSERSGAIDVGERPMYQFLYALTILFGMGGAASTTYGFVSGAGFFQSEHAELAMIGGIAVLAASVFVGFTLTKALKESRP